MPIALLDGGKGPEKRSVAGGQPCRDGEPGAMIGKFSGPRRLEKVSGRARPDARPAPGLAREARRVRRGPVRTPWNRERSAVPKRTDIRKILIIGAGPIVIGQACEFDY